jgi:hypothetical protein
MARVQTFTTIRTEGALLPPDLLRRIQDGDRSLPGLTPESYHLPGTMRLGEAIGRSWNALLGAWASFAEAKEKVPAGDPGTSVTREKWLLPLFQELNYGRVQTRAYPDIDGKSYPISHGWGHVPIHLVGAGIDLDRRSAGVAGAARSSPHSLVQEFLNRNDEHLWGVVSNGLRLRLLRDNVSLTRQAFVEFDLEAMMAGEVYANFVLLWMLLHQSRIESNKPQECLLEQWSRQAAEEGTRALDSLRSGVEHAIRALGKGFLAHPANDALRTALRSGDLSAQDYYRQILRLVYRLLFLFVAEDRDLLHHPEASDDARARFQPYSTRRLRELADTLPGSRHVDLFEALKVVMHSLGSDKGAPVLGLPPLGGFLFSERATPNLSRAQIANAHLLQAIRGLAFVADKNGRRPVDYKNLGSEELGSVYESLLELHPELDTAAATFTLTTAPGNERKNTGSYYTPSSLITLLLDSALEPVIADAVKSKTGVEAEIALLNLKVVDPACGSGHFLIAAARRLAKRLAAIRTGDDEPAPETLRHALRDVIGRCIYGVDINEMSAELCKVALWMEALEPGKPLTFLEHRIQVGNSLLGATPKLIAGGLPDDAFNPIEGDDKKIANAAKKRNREERQGQMGIFESAPVEGNQAIAQAFAELTTLPDDLPEQIRAKEERLEQLLTDERYAVAKLATDAWCAAFMWSKEPGRPPAPTTGTLRRLLERGAMDEAQRREVERSAKYYQFFHWHLAFPEVFLRQQAGGFDVVLGNPPFGNNVGSFGSSSRQPNQREIQFFACNLKTAQRAFDISVLFFEIGISALRERGRYGLFSPLGIWASSGGKAWRDFLIEDAPPTFFLVAAEGNWFPGASVQTGAIAGVVGDRKANWVQVVTSGPARQFMESPTSFTGSMRTFYEIVAKPSETSIQIKTKTSPLSMGFEVFAGCATGAAYELAPLIVDSKDDAGLKLINTKLIDRFRDRWGKVSITYLKKHYGFPHWPALDHAIDKSVRRAALRQMRPKLLVAGLTKVLESCGDYDGTLGGVVQTWVIVEGHNNVRLLKRLLACLNSWILSYRYWREEGAQSIVGGGMTIKKNALQALSIPDSMYVLLENQTKLESLKYSSIWDCPVTPHNEATAWLDVEKLVGRIEELAHSGNPFLSEEAELNSRICWLYGLDILQYDELKEWHRARDLKDPER